MLATIGRKLPQYILVLLAAIALNFFLPRAMPGNPLVLLAGEDVGLLAPEQRAEILERHNLNDPLPIQFVNYLGGLATGDWGYSYQQKQPVLLILQQRIGWTLLLAGSALVLATIIGLVSGIFSAWRRGSRVDVGFLSLFLSLDAMPSFWVGMIFIAIFGVQFGWFPTYGAQTAWVQNEGWAQVVDVAHHLVLPLVTLTLGLIPGTYVVTRNGMLDVLGEGYIDTARAKGLRERAVLFGHAARNGLLPVATVFALNLGYVVSGATVIETVFAYPGIGRLLFEATLNRDYPLLQGAFLLIVIGVLLASVFADLLYPLLDPRVRAE